jgi:hypothetical protein
MGKGFFAVQNLPMMMKNPEAESGRGLPLREFFTGIYPFWGAVSPVEAIGRVYVEWRHR